MGRYHLPIQGRDPSKKAMIGILALGLGALSQGLAGRSMAVQGSGTGLSGFPGAISFEQSLRMLILGMSE